MPLIEKPFEDLTHAIEYLAKSDYVRYHAPMDNRPVSVEVTKVILDKLQPGKSKFSFRIGKQKHSNLIISKHLYRLSYTKFV